MTANSDRAAPELRLRRLGGLPEIVLASPRLVVAGYTGRDPAIVAAHIAELAQFGVAPPLSVPTFYDLDPALLTTDPVVEVDAPQTSGEVEPVLIRHAGVYYLGVGSDHTDRVMERSDVAAAKAACPKPLAAEVLDVPAGLDDLDWDAITVEAQVDGARYQHADLALLRTPSDLLARLSSRLGPIDADLVVFAGTVPLLDGSYVPGARWTLTLTAASGRLSHTYQVERRTP